MKLTRKTAELIKAIAFWINEAITWDWYIRHNLAGGYTVYSLTILLNRRHNAIKKIGRYSTEFQKQFNLSNRKFHKIIFELVRSQFVNSKVFSMGEDFNEALDGPIHPELKNSWVDTLDGYQLYFMPTSEMVSMKF